MGKYKVYAGEERPAFIEGHHLEKSSGQTQKAQGGKTVIYSVPAGTVGFPNQSEAWGVRLDKDGKVPESPLSVTDSRYDGKVKFLEWGKEGGSLIVTRHLTGYNTLDQQFQKLVLRADERIKEDSDEWYIRLKTGLNEFDEVKDALFIEHLKHHSYNRESKSKNPEVYIDYKFFEKDEVKAQKHNTSLVEHKLSAIGVVKSAASDNTLKQLWNVYRGVKQAISGEPNDGNIYDLLMQAADTTPDTFMAQVEQFKKHVSNNILKCQSYKVIDFSVKGVVAGGTPKNVLSNSLPKDKSEAKMIDHLLTNWYRNNEHQVILEILEISEKIK
jgi:hypothetical protein